MHNYLKTYNAVDVNNHIDLQLSSIFDNILNGQGVLCVAMSDSGYVSNTQFRTTTGCNWNSAATDVFWFRWKACAYAQF